MEISIGKYEAVKDCAMSLSGQHFLLMDGGNIEVEQIDSPASKALVRCDGIIDWMHFSRIKKCFKRSGT